jgi:hypothetical protein
LQAAKDFAMTTQHRFSFHHLHKIAAWLAVVLPSFSKQHRSIIFRKVWMFAIHVSLQIGERPVATWANTIANSLLDLGDDAFGRG